MAELLDRGYALIMALKDAEMRRLISDEKDLSIFLAWMRTRSVRQLTYFLQRILHSTNPAIQMTPLSANHPLSSFLNELGNW